MVVFVDQDDGLSACGPEGCFAYARYCAVRFKVVELPFSASLHENPVVSFQRGRPLGVSHISGSFRYHQHEAAFEAVSGRMSEFAEIHAYDRICVLVDSAFPAGLYHQAAEQIRLVLAVDAEIIIQHRQVGAFPEAAGAGVEKGHSVGAAHVPDHHRFVHEVVSAGDQQSEIGDAVGEALLSHIGGVVMFIYKTDACLQR